MHRDMHVSSKLVSKLEQKSIRLSDVYCRTHPSLMKQGRYYGINLSPWSVKTFKPSMFTALTVKLPHKRKQPRWVQAFVVSPWRLSSRGVCRVIARRPSSSVSLRSHPDVVVMMRISQSKLTSSSTLPSVRYPLVSFYSGFSWSPSRPRQEDCMRPVSRLPVRDLPWKQTDRKEEHIF